MTRAGKLLREWVVFGVFLASWPCVAGAGSYGKRSCFGGSGDLGDAAGRDVRPAAHLLFFASPKKSRQKKGDPTCRVPSLRCGQPAMLGHGAALRNSLCGYAAPLKQPQRVRARSMVLLRSPCPPHALRFSARPEGSGEKTGHRCARPQGSHTGRSARTGAPRRPRSRPNQRTPSPGLARPLALSLPKQEGGRGPRLRACLRRHVQPEGRGAGHAGERRGAGLARPLALSPLPKREGGRREATQGGITSPPALPSPAACCGCACSAPGRRSSPCRCRARRPAARFRAASCRRCAGRGP